MAMEWQERITRETDPSIQLEHELRYRMAVPLISGAGTWLELGSGTGIAAAAALGGQGPARAVLVDVSADILAQAADEVPAGEAVTVEADLASAEGLAAVRTALADAHDGVATCFELIEHLETFVGVVELLIELSEQRGFTVVLSVPNDAFWPIESPWHKTMWGEGSFEELRRLLPAEHVVAEQLPVQGSSIAPGGAAVPEPLQLAAPDDAVPSHFVAAFGPRCREIGAVAGVATADLSARRRWERQREANLALYEDRMARYQDHIKWTEREFEDWRAYINELEAELGRPLTAGPSNDP